MENPWNIQSIYELLFFNCPSCIFKNNSKQEFISHACELHPESIEYLKKINDKSINDIILPSKHVAKQIKIEPQNIDEFVNDNTNTLEDTKDVNPIHIEKMLDIKIEEKDIVFPSNQFANNDPLYIKTEQIEEQNYYLNEYPMPNEQNVFEKYKCGFCQNVFGQSGSLKRHIKLVHEGVKDHTCDHCGKTFGRGYNLKMHLKTDHEGVKELKYCKFCGKGFTRVFTLQEHIKTVHEGLKKSFHCNNCSKVFGQQRLLNRHIKLVHDVVKIHNCEHCNKTFGRKDHLKNHIKTVHEGVKEFKCEQCEKAFGEHENLKKHIKTVHEGIKDFKCSQCDKVFSRKGNLNTHIRNYHEGLKMTESSIYDQSPFIEIKEEII